MRGGEVDVARRDMRGTELSEAEKVCAASVVGGGMDGCSPVTKLWRANGRLRGKGVRAARLPSAETRLESPPADKSGLVGCRQKQPGALS